jgi:hypothetical protein
MAGGTDPFFICEESTPNDDSTSLSFLEDSLSTVVNSTRACVSSDEDSLSTSHWRSPKSTNYRSNHYHMQCSSESDV